MALLPFPRMHPLAAGVSHKTSYPLARALPNHDTAPFLEIGDQVWAKLQTRLLILNSRSLLGQDGSGNTAISLSVCIYHS